MSLYVKDKIVALATPKGFGALAVVRVSGQSLKKLFTKVTKHKSPKPRYAYFKKFFSSDGSILDKITSATDESINKAIESSLKEYEEWKNVSIS